MDASAATRRHHLPHAVGFWVVAGAYAVLSAFGTAPTPLWPLYQQVDGFGPLVVTIAFAIMVVGVIASLALFGHLSDRLGRLRIIAPALFVALGADYVLIAWPQLPGLLIGRFLTGVGIGLMAASATAYLADLDRVARPHVTAPALPGLVAAGASLGGLALGPVIAGGLAELLPEPLLLPYVVLGLLVLAALALVMATPETVDVDASPPAEVRRVEIRPGRSAVFVGASLLGFAAFGATGVFSSVGSLVIRNDLHIHDVFVGGMATFAVFAASAAAQLLLGRLPVRTLAAGGTVLYVLGLAMTALSVAHPSLGLFLTAALATGSGTGMLFKTGLVQAAGSAAAASRAGVLAIFYVVAYLGMGVPSVTFGVLVTTLGTTITMVVLGGALGLVAIVGALIVVASAQHR